MPLKPSVNSTLGKKLKFAATIGIFYNFQSQKNYSRNYSMWISGKCSRCLHKHQAPTENISIRCSFSFQPKGKKVLRNLSYVLCQVEVLAFLFAFLMAGILWGYLENFLFWHLEDLGATKFLMGTYILENILSFKVRPLFEFECICAKVKHCCRLKSIPVAEFSALQLKYYGNTGCGVFKRGVQN